MGALAGESHDVGHDSFHLPDARQMAIPVCVDEKITPSVTVSVKAVPVYALTISFAFFQTHPSPVHLCFEGIEMMEKGELIGDVGLRLLAQLLVRLRYRRRPENSQLMFDHPLSGISRRLGRRDPDRLRGLVKRLANVLIAQMKESTKRIGHGLSEGALLHELAEEIVDSFDFVCERREQLGVIDAPGRVIENRLPESHEALAVLFPQKLVGIIRGRDGDRCKAYP